MQVTLVPKKKEINDPTAAYTGRKVPIPLEPLQYIVNLESSLGMTLDPVIILKYLDQRVNQSIYGTTVGEGVFSTHNKLTLFFRHYQNDICYVRLRGNRSSLLPPATTHTIPPALALYSWTVCGKL